MSFLSKILAGSEDRVVQHNYEYEEEYSLKTLGKLKLEPGDIVVFNAPEEADHIVEKIRHTGDSLEQYLGWRPLVLAIPKGWEVGVMSRTEVAEFCRNVLRALEAQS